MVVISSMLIHLRPNEITDVNYHSAQFANSVSEEYCVHNLFILTAQCRWKLRSPKVLRWSQPACPRYGHAGVVPVHPTGEGGNIAVVRSFDSTQATWPSRKR